MDSATHHHQDVVQSAAEKHSARWSLSCDTYEDVAFLKQPCTIVAVDGEAPPALLHADARHVHTCDGGIIAIKRPEPTDNEAAPVYKKSCKRDKLVIAHCGTPVFVPRSCRMLHWEETLKPFRVSVWESRGQGQPNPTAQTQELGHMVSSPGDALELLVRLAEEKVPAAEGAQNSSIEHDGKPSSTDIHFELIIECASLLPEQQPSELGTQQTHRNSWQQKRLTCSQARASVMSCIVGEIVLGGKVAGSLQRGRKGVFADRLTTTCLSDRLESSNDLEVDLATQVGTWLAEFLQSPPMWRMLHMTPSHMGQETDYFPHVDRPCRDLDICVQSCLSIRTSCAQADITEFCKSVSIVLRKLAGLPSDSSQLEVGVFNGSQCVVPRPPLFCDSWSSTPKPTAPTRVLRDLPQLPNSRNVSSPTGSTLRPMSPEALQAAQPSSPRIPRCSPQPSPTLSGNGVLILSRPTSAPSVARTLSSPRRRQFRPAMQTMAPNCQPRQSIDLNLMLYRAGFGHGGFALGTHNAGGISHTPSRLLHLEPGSSVGLHLCLPPEALRLPFQAPHLFVALLHRNAAPWNFNSLSELALVMERLPTGTGRALQAGLDIQLPVPEGLKVNSTTIQIELRIYAVELGGAQGCGGGRIVAVGRPLSCCIGGTPGPLALLTALSTSLVRRRLSKASLPEPASLESASRNAQLAGVDDVSDFWGALQNSALEPSTLWLCSVADEPRLRHIIAESPGDRLEVTGGEFITMGPPTKMAGPPAAPLVQNSTMLGARSVVCDSVLVLALLVDQGIETYRVECARVAPLGPRSIVGTAPKSFFYLTAHVPAGTPINTRLLFRIECLMPGRYTFRIQARVPNTCVYSAFSMPSTPECLLPDIVGQKASLEKVESAMCLGRRAGSSQKLRWAIKEALDSGVDPEDRTITEAYTIMDSIEDCFRRQSFNSWRHAEDALDKVQAQLRRQYRPGLERAMSEAVEAGVHNDHPDIIQAKQMLSELKEIEAVTRMHASRRDRMCEQATEQLKNAMQSPRDYKAGHLEEALAFAEKAGLPPEAQVVRKAKDALKGARISISVARRANLRHTQEDSRKESIKQNSMKKASAKQGKSYLRKGTGVRGKSPSQPSTQRMWPKLLEAARTGQVDEVEKLLLLGADSAAFESNQGMSALCLAAQQGHIMVMKCLVRAKALVDQRDDMGSTALMHCVTNNDGHRTLSTLFTAAADVNATNAYGKTALHFAAGSQRFRCIRTLLTAKANADISDTSGDTPLAIAEGLPDGVAKTLVLEALSQKLAGRDDHQRSSTKDSGESPFQSEAFQRQITVPAPESPFQSESFPRQITV